MASGHDLIFRHALKAYNSGYNIKTSCRLERMTYSTADFGLIFYLEQRAGEWVIVSRLLGPEQRITSLGAIATWGCDLAPDVPLELDGQRFDIVIKTRQNPPRCYGIVTR